MGRESGPALAVYAAACENLGALGRDLYVQGADLELLASSRDGCT
jgi:hypothetical protein